jgi:hypothetical protein
MSKQMLGMTAAAITSLVCGAAVAPADGAVRMQAQSYAELLQPIPNATEQLKIADMQAGPADARLIEAQYTNHHHQHYRRHWRRRPQPHHHHHNNGPNPY